MRRQCEAWCSLILFFLICPFAAAQDKVGGLESYQTGQQPQSALLNRPGVVSQTVQETVAESVIARPAVDHSKLLWLSSLDRATLRHLMETGGSPSLAELDGFWYAYNMGRFSERFGFSQIIKYIDTTSGYPIGRNFLAQQQPIETLQFSGWKPKLNPATGGYIQDSSFGLAPPSGVGPLGHAVNGVYAWGDDGPRFPLKRVVTWIVRLDADHYLGMSGVRIGRRYLPVGFFVMQRIR
jgi:hypothetical protein